MCGVCRCWCGWLGSRGLADLLHEPGHSHAHMLLPRFRTHPPTPFHHLVMLIASVCLLLLGVNHLYENKGGRFESATSGVAGPIATDSANSRGAAWADYDGDGDLDLFVANSGPLKFEAWGSCLVCGVCRGWYGVVGLAGTW